MAASSDTLMLVENYTWIFTWLNRTIMTARHSSCLTKSYQKKKIIQNGRNKTTTRTSNSLNPTNSVFSNCPALYASVLLGLGFGVLSMVAALAVAVPATFVTWITILVLLTFAGKNRRDLVLEGKKLTGDIIGFVVKVLIKEWNVVAALCAVLGYFALLVRRNKQQEDVDY
ncbi:uncharacterized protein LOC132639943 [Lycium barbarum]|uniref:uncharacterized protein LOC132639943 n=1 Tax=Lycium barbarum TaxID=112863 RepID=UPI00293F56D3|nr:uncharacterized protein LOC132639943 [Lycium barbarum]